jgi:hypothetical protein
VSTSPQVAFSDRVIEVAYGHALRCIPVASQLSKIEIGPEYIGHALRDKHLFVPTNQRDYSWKDEHVHDLYDDLGLAISNHAEEYFLGSIVVIPQAKSGRLMVVDGQQRLATALIFLAAIRDYFDTVNPDEARKFERAYVLDTPYVLVKRDPLQVRIGMAERVHELAQQEFFRRAQGAADPGCILSPSV